MAKELVGRRVEVEKATRVMGQNVEKKELQKKVWDMGQLKHTKDSGTRR